jgi:hypothetical protein
LESEIKQEKNNGASKKDPSVKEDSKKSFSAGTTVDLDIKKPKGKDKEDQLNLF